MKEDTKTRTDILDELDDIRRKFEKKGDKEIKKTNQYLDCSFLTNLESLKHEFEDKADRHVKRAGFFYDYADRIEQIISDIEVYL